MKIFSTLVEIHRLLVADRAVCPMCAIGIAISVVETRAGRHYDRPVRCGRFSRGARCRQYAFGILKRAGVLP